MNRQTWFALAAVAAAASSTLVAFRTMWRLLSKMGEDVLQIGNGLFLRHTLPCMAVGLALVVLAVCVSERRPRTALLLLIAAPAAALFTEFALLLFQ